MVLEKLNVLGHNLEGAALFIFLFLAMQICFQLFAYLILYIAKHFASKTETDFDDKVVDEIKSKSKYIAGLLSTYLSLEMVYGEIQILEIDLLNWLIAGLILVAGASVIKILQLFVEFYAKELGPKRGVFLDHETTILFKNIIKYVLYIFLFLTLLGSFGVNIAPLIAGLGIAGLAVGLALQDTLANFFAGVYLLVERPIKIGDNVKINDIEGSVTEIGWRSTKMVTWDNNLIVIPNKKVLDNTIINYLRPNTSIMFPFTVSVSYDSDVEKVMSIARSISEDMANEKILSSQFPFSVRLDKFGESSLDFRMSICVPSFNSRFSIYGEFMKRLLARFRKEGIEIPYPTRTIHITNKQEDKQTAKKQAKRKKK